MDIKLNTPCPIEWKSDCLTLIDQRLLPHEETWVEVRTIEDCHAAIKTMVVRGAPCIGFTAIFGMALYFRSAKEYDLVDIKERANYLISARPTAVNLAYEVNRCIEKVKDHNNIDAAYLDLINFGIEQLELSHKKNTQMAQIALGDLDENLKKNKYRFLTHCNTGYLACGSLGTALGVISYAHAHERVEHVYADETRPYLQGSRLTAYELMKEGVPHSIVVEGAASYLMKNNLVDAIYIGADRIAANGDTANKIGSSTLAIVAKHYRIPFYVVAPTSSFDLDAFSGDSIDIELRDESEIKEINGVPIAPLTSPALNPSFDITDSDLITGIICEKGMIKPPFNQNVRKVVLS